MNWLIGILFANVSITALEYIYRTSQFSSYLSALPYVLPLYIIAQAGLFYGFRGGGASSLIYAGIVFSFVNLACRVGVTLYIGEEVATATWIALALTALATGIGALK
jgi:hypothetical protein